MFSTTLSTGSQLYPGDLWIVDLNAPGQDFSAEIIKIRPAVILNCRKDRFDRTIAIVVPLSSRLDLMDRFSLLIQPTIQNGLRSTGMAVPDHLRSIDPRRCRHRIGRLDDSTFGKLRQAAIDCLSAA